MNRLFILLLFLFISIVNIKAQKGAEVGAWMGSSFYFGDLNNLYRLTEPGLSGGLLFRYNVNSRLSPQCQINYSRLRANDVNSSNLARNIIFCVRYYLKRDSNCGNGRKKNRHVYRAFFI